MAVPTRQPSRETVRRFACPTCKALPDQLCLGRRNPPQRRISSHAARVWLAIDELRFPVAPRDAAMRSL